MATKQGVRRQIASDTRHRNCSGSNSWKHPKYFISISALVKFVYILIYCFLILSDHIPEDLQDPFYTDQYDQEHIKPPVIRLLLSCELYCRVCALILKGDQVASLQSHQSVIQALSRKGIYVMEGDDTPVTDSDLSCQPIKMVRFESLDVFGI